MNVETFCLGSLETNAYVVSAEGSECWVFDCPGEPESMIKALKDRGFRPQGLYLTHAHVDHMAGVEAFRRAFPGVPLHQHPLEVDWLVDPQKNLSAWMGDPVTAGPAEVLVDEGSLLTLGPWTVRVLHLPGHSPGSVGYWFTTEEEVIAGDVLFRSGVGRWDFPGCRVSDLRRSLGRLTELPEATRVRPGHGGSTTIRREKGTNPYLRSDDLWRD